MKILQNSMHKNADLMIKNMKPSHKFYPVLLSYFKLKIYSKYIYIYIYIYIYMLPTN